MWDWSAFFSAAVPATITLIGVILSNRKQANLMAYRIDQLEKKQDKHNNLIERTFKLEQQVADLEKRIK
ncbi:MAG: hypothetical protein J6Y20_05100 [Lachnospiraceae bacterium]|nr:hypothetical protein [Lachnospiraceae bacterium]